MIARKHVLTTLALGAFALVLASFSQPAAAAPRYYPDTYAGTTIQRSIYESAGQHRFYTFNLQPYGSCSTPDTVMFVQAPDGQSAMNDDCPGGGLGSCVTLDSSESGYWKVVIFPYSTGSCGTTDLLMDNGTIIPLSSNVFAATVLYSGVETGHSYSYETVEPPTGATDTVMYLFNSTQYNVWNERAFDDDDGLGLQARFIATAASGDRIVLASYSPSEQGFTNLLINSCTGDPDAGGAHDCADYDGDYLSNQLEQEIGTYDNNWDSDGDGISDYYEVYGRRLNFQMYDWTNQEPLVSEGANPLHRDLFVEVDEEKNADQTGSVPPMPQTQVDKMWDTFDAISTISNPDGFSGVSVHVDTGQSCPGEPTACGNWGGSEGSLPYDGSYATDGTYAQIRDDGHFAQVRWGVFHYAYLTNYGTGTNSGNPGSSLYSNGTQGNDAQYVQHELGHGFDLEHWGVDAYPASERMNNKMAYPSLMNYAYQNNDNPYYTPRFSDGSRATIHPYDLPETDYSPGADITYLQGKPFYLKFNGNWVDFNSDGRFTAGGVAFDTSAVEKKELQPGWPDLYQRRTFAEAAPAGGAAMVVDPTAGNGTTAWEFSPYPDGTGDPTPMTIAANQVYFNDLTGPDWTIKPRPPDLSDSGGVGDVTAAWFPVGANNEIVLLYRNASAALSYYLVDTNNPGGGSWQPIPNWPSGVTATNASATVSGGTIAGGKLVVVFRDASTDMPNLNVYITTMDSSGNWSTPELVQGVGSLVTPGLAEAADGKLYMAIAAKDQFGNYPITFVRKDSGSLGDGTGWAAAGLGSTTSHLTRSNDAGARINLLSLPYLDSSRQPFSDGSGYLALFWNDGDPNQSSGTADNWRLYRAYTTGYFAPPPGVSTAGPPLGGRWQAQIDRAYPGHSLGVAEHDGNVMAFYTGSFWGTPYGGVPGPYPNSTWFAPYVTGITPIDPGLDNDHDDGATIAANMCSAAALLRFSEDGSHASCYCQTGDPNATCLNAPTVAVTPMTQPCDFSGGQ